MTNELTTKKLNAMIKSGELVSIKDDLFGVKTYDVSDKSIVLANSNNEVMAIVKTIKVNRGHMIELANVEIESARIERVEDGRSIKSTRIFYYDNSIYVSGILLHLQIDKLATIDNIIEFKTDPAVQFIKDIFGNKCFVGDDVQISTAGRDHIFGTISSFTAAGSIKMDSHVDLRYKTTHGKRTILSGSQDMVLRITELNYKSNIVRMMLGE